MLYIYIYVCVCTFFVYNIYFSTLKKNTREKKWYGGFGTVKDLMQITIKQSSGHAFVYILNVEFFSLNLDPKWMWQLLVLNEVAEKKSAWR